MNSTYLFCPAFGSNVLDSVDSSSIDQGIRNLEEEERSG